MKTITMLDVLRELERVEGKKAFDIFEWYCQTYGLGVEDDATATIVHEVFGD